jgi:MFS family permease
MIIGLFASLLKGGAIFVQMISAFYAQSYRYMMPYLRLVFLSRFLSWFGIGVVIAVFGEDSPQLTLTLIGIGLFIFSFSAGFGAIYFKEIQAKVFSNSFRGKTMAYRQFFSGFGAILSGAAAGAILHNFEPPMSFAYLFMISALIMAIGLVAFASIEEPPKEDIKEREGSFIKFLQNSFIYFREDQQLRKEILSYLLSYSHLLALPFIVLQAEKELNLTGFQIGLFVSAQMLGAMLSNILWGKLSFKEKNREIVVISYLLMILSFGLATVFQNFYIYSLIFFLIGASTDGLRLAFGNLILIIAPSDKRPIYVALQANISSFGLFFPVLGGLLLSFISYEALYLITIGMLFYGLYYIRK